MEALRVLCGTGSRYGLADIETWRSFVAARVPFGIVVHLGAGILMPPDAVPPETHLDGIRSVLTPRMSDLSSLLGVSRQAVYNWMAGKSNPEEKHLARIHELSRIAGRFREARVRRADTLFKMKAFDGQSLRDLVKAGKNRDSHVDILIAEAQAMDAAYRASGLAGLDARPESDWASYLSLPGQLEGPFDQE